MITLYHCDAARSFRPLWMLEEMGLPYELKMLPFPPRVFAKEYLALNPLGTIPFMVDGETKMTESSGICHYLGIKHGPTPLMVGPEDPAYGAFLNWMYFSDATLTFPRRWCSATPSSSRKSAATRRSLATMPNGFWAGCAPSRQRRQMLKHCAPVASPPLILSSAMRFGWPTISGSPRISGQMSRPIGRACSSAAASDALLLRSKRPAPSRMLHRV